MNPKNFTDQLFESANAARSEFPGNAFFIDDHVLKGLEELGFEDTSYRNDSCPSFKLQIGNYAYRATVDCTNPEDRELQGEVTKRFSLFLDGDGDEELISTDSFEEFSKFVEDGRMMHSENSEDLIGP